jgi:uncharacterized protein YecA (UPF0149 family)
MIEGEFHSVWRSPSNDLIDVTPTTLRNNRILFLSDDRRKYDGHQVDNVRRALNNDQATLDFIKVCEEIFKVTNSGDLAYQHGQISLPRALIEPLHLRKRELQAKIAKRYLGPNSLCPCGSGKKNKKCCRTFID